MTIVVTEIDRVAGTFTVNTLVLDAFNQILKEYYGPDVIAGFGQHGFTSARTTIPVIDSPIRFRDGPPAVTVGAVVALATLGSLEWLRRRKAEVAEAERTGDYSSLLAEFVAWLRSVLDAWRAVT